MAGPTPEPRPGARAKGLAWIIGLALTSIPVAAVLISGGSRDLAGPVALLGLAVTALIAELAAFGSSGRSETPTPRDARPADGVVEIVPMTGAEGEPNSVAPRLLRLATLDRGPSPSIARPAGPPRLLGRVALISLFVGLDGRRWTDREIAQGFRSLERAGIWLEREASLREIPLNVVLAAAYVGGEEASGPAVELHFQPEGDDVGPMEADAMTKYLAVASRAAAPLGCADLADLVARAESRVEADAHAWLLHLRGAGRSLAIAGTESELPGVGLAVCFAREASFPEPLEGPGRVDPLTVAHELLHLFGASDKYGTDLDAFPDGSVTDGDVMRMDHESLSRLRIDDRTAAEVGWGGTTRKWARKKPAGDL